MPEEKQCPFCKVNKLRNRIIEYRQNHFVTMSNPRLMEGHLLVIPRAHVGALYKLPLGEQAEVMQTVFRFQRILIEIFSKLWDKPAGCDVSWHTRPFMPQTTLSIPGHAHIHLRPRFWKDPYYEGVLKYETPMFQELSREEAKRIQELLKDSWKR